MRHLNTGRKFDRNSSNRRAMFKNLVANLIAHGEIETTVAKAKELRRIAERVITKAKRVGTDMNKAELDEKANARRLAVKRDLGKFLPHYSERIVNGETEQLDVVEHLFREVAPRFLSRPGGYTKIIRTRNRRGDNAELALIRFVDYVPQPKKQAVSADSGVNADVSAVRSSAPKEETKSE